MSFPLGATWDLRDDPTDARRGVYLDGEVQPFIGFDRAASGLRATADARAYRNLGERVVLAGRLQLGTVFGPTLLETPRDFLFYSGGGGTVRGQEYQSLGVDVLRAGFGTLRTGGQHFAGLQSEVRVKVRGAIGAVGFFDAGYVAATEWGDGDWQAGAGFGLRYATAIGPIRADVGFPVGDMGEGAQLYIGIGQAF